MTNPLAWLVVAAIIVIPIAVVAACRTQNCSDKRGSARMGRTPGANRGDMYSQGDGGGGGGGDGGGDG
jgi:hypothetical protein